jgi:hypothetical protein
VQDVILRYISCGFGEMMLEQRDSIVYVQDVILRYISCGFGEIGIRAGFRFLSGNG